MCGKCEETVSAGALAAQTPEGPGNTGTPAPENKVKGVRLQLSIVKRNTKYSQEAHLIERQGMVIGDPQTAAASLIPTEAP